MDVGVDPSRMKTIAATAAQAGVTFETILRADVRSRRFDQGAETDEEYVARRLRSHRNPTGPVERTDALGIEDTHGSGRIEHGVRSGSLGAHRGRRNGERRLFRL